jgi:hypothetical protein
MLSGTLDEQCAFLYNLAQEKVEAGNYTGAVHALKEIQKYAPTYPGAAELMARALAGKREQRKLVLSGFGGAVIAIFVGTWWGVPNDLWFLGMAIAGAVIGYLIATAAASSRKQRNPASHASK